MSQQKSGNEREEPNAYGAFEAIKDKCKCNTNTYRNANSDTNVIYKYKSKYKYNNSLSATVCRNKSQSVKEREQLNAYGAFEAVGLEVEKYTQVKIVWKKYC